MSGEERTQAQPRAGEAKNNHALYMREWRKKQRAKRLAAVIARHSQVSRETMRETSP